MTISAPFPAKRCRNPSIYIDPDMLDAIDAVRVAENGQKPLSRSATVRHLLSFALALMVDEDAIAEFVAEHAEKAPPLPSRPLDLRNPS